MFAFSSDVRRSAGADRTKYEKQRKTKSRFAKDSVCSSARELIAKIVIEAETAARKLKPRRSNGEKLA